jgi:hypothetical protein
MHDERPEQGRGMLPAVALGGAVAGAICAVGFTTYAGARVGSPLVLRLLFGVWVCSPFAALLMGRAMSGSWRPSMRGALHAVTLLIAAGSPLAYAYFALGVARPATAAFVVIAPASWLVTAVALGAAAFSARK